MMCRSEFCGLRLTLRPIVDHTAGNIYECQKSESYQCYEKDVYHCSLFNEFSKIEYITSLEPFRAIFLHSNHNFYIFIF